MPVCNEKSTIIKSFFLNFFLENKIAKFLKNYLRPYYWPLYAKIWAKNILTNNWSPSLLGVYGPLTSCTVSKKSHEPIPRINIYQRTKEWIKKGKSKQTNE